MNKSISQTGTMAPVPAIPSHGTGSMKATIMTASVSRSGGGVSEIARRVSQTLSERTDVQVDVLGLNDDFTVEDLPAWQPLVPQSFAVRGPRSYGYAPALRQAFDQLSPDVAHVHGIWMYPTLAAANWSRRTGRPFIVTLHGMMEPWAMNHSRFKKRLALTLVERRALRRAACLQVNTRRELEHVRAFGLTNPVCVIPNGVDLPSLTESSRAASKAHLPWKKSSANERTLLYLGRIHPKKGLRNLVTAFAQVHQDGRTTQPWKLVVAGWDQGGHEQELKSLVGSLGLQDAVEFVGPQFGKAKTAAMLAADGFVLPSYSEGLPMVVLEAWAHALPVLMTPECNLEEGFANGSAYRVGTDAASVVEGLTRFFALSDDERRESGRRGREFVARRYTWPSVAKQLLEVYQWMTHQGPRPDCVVM